jgi:uncharacterized membrane protein
MTVLFLSLRILHVLLAAIWIGSTVFIQVMLMPAIRESGPTGGQIMVRLTRRGLPAYMASIGGVTVLTGFYLFWRFTGGFSPEVSSSPGGMMFGTGAIAGILALIIGGAVVGGSAKKASAIVERMASAPEQDRPAMVAQIQALSQRMGTFGAIVIVLQAIALATMAIGHYV